MSETQKVIKYFAILLAILIIISVFSGIYSFGIFLSNGFIDTDEGININRYDDYTNILNINLTSSELVLKTGNRFQVETNNKYIETKQENNKLSIIEKKNNFFNNSEGKVVVYIPEGITFDMAYISSGAGKITIEELSSNELELDLESGKLEIENLEVSRNANIETGAGKVDIRYANINNLDLDLGTGSFLMNAILTGDNEIDAGIGKLDLNFLDNEENYQLILDKGLGSLNINNKSYSTETNYGTGINKVEINGGIGDIDILFNKSYQQ